MKPKVKFFIILGILILSLAIFGYFKAIPEAEDQNNVPKIEITPKSWDFGDVEYGQVLEHNFKVKNSGNIILEIKRVATSCACTTGKVEKDKLNPGEETNLLARYDTGSMSGPHGQGEQERIIFIKTNDPINPQVEVEIHAYVR